MKAMVVVVGGGHAGIEASLSLARMKIPVTCLTLKSETIGTMSCNPSIGGIGKGHIVREIDALGGAMGYAADHCGIEFRTLNQRRGPAVQAPRAQCDRMHYSRYMRKMLIDNPMVTIVEDACDTIIIEGDSVKGVRTAQLNTIPCMAVIITTGTFLRGLMHTGQHKKTGGREGEGSVKNLSHFLKDELGMSLVRLKTGTPPRLKKSTLNFDRMEAQPPCLMPTPFSWKTPAAPKSKIQCFITHTTQHTHDIIAKNKELSPIFSGQITATGPRYCPSIEDKVFRFPDRESHQIFLEPESIETDWYYPNGLSTSLPIHLQKEILSTIPGCENSEIVQQGYAVEYDAVNPIQLDKSLKVNGIDGLYTAGQINGTSGYEEAAGQGIIAGINAGLYIKEEEPFIIRRDESYIGVMIDDLTTHGVQEPYRMFTSRAEFRLHLRCDNAQDRLIHHAKRTSVISENDFNLYEDKKNTATSITNWIRNHRITLNDHNNINEPWKSFLNPGDTPAHAIRRARETSLETIIPALADIAPWKKIEVDNQTKSSIVFEIRYEGYLKRQERLINWVKSCESMEIPKSINYENLSFLRAEAREKLQRVQPHTIAQAHRISGITAAEIEHLAILVSQNRSKRHA